MIKSESIKELAGALAKAQSKITGAKTTSENPYFKSKYADLGDVWDSIREPLSSNGLSVTQTTGFNGEKLMVTTTLMHLSGEFISGETPVLTKEMTAQAMGSAITYARRYGLAAIAGVYQVDDDGNSATHEKPLGGHVAEKPSIPTPAATLANPNPFPTAPPNHAPGAKGPSEAQIKRLWAMSKNLGWSVGDTLTNLKQKTGKSDPSALTWQEYKKYTDELDQLIKKSSPPPSDDDSGPMPF
jgi:hypothetical protein